MITNKDIRVENGNLVLNGDKYPLDGQSPKAIMDIVKSNSDTTPTAKSTAPVTSAGIKTYVDNAVSQKSDIFFSPTTSGATHTIDVGTVAVVANRMFLLSSGYPSAYVFGLLFITYDNTITYIDISHNGVSVDSVTYTEGVVTVTLSNTTYTTIGLTRIC